MVLSVSMKFATSSQAPWVSTCLQDTWSSALQGRYCLLQEMHCLLLPATCQSSQPERGGGGGDQSPQCVAVFGTLECTENLLVSKILQDCNWAWLKKITLHFVRCKLFHKKLSLIPRQQAVPFQLCSKKPCHISMFKRIKGKKSF